MNCPYCGNPIKENQRFCTRCGAPQKQISQSPVNCQEATKHDRKVLPIVLIIIAVLLCISIAVLILLLSNNQKPAPKVALNSQPQTTAETEKPTEKATEATKPAPTEKPFSITPEEIDSEIEWIRACYYTPGSDDTRRELTKGENGWDYARDYRYHNGKLIFAFVFDGSEEHRLYFKDDRMIRYIDENHTTFDYPATEPYTSWEQKVLSEAYEHDGKRIESDSSPWLGTWTAENGASLSIQSVTESGISLVFHKQSESGSWMDIDYEMEFDNADGTIASEIGGAQDHGGWEYTFILNDGFITVKSRYPDQIFYKS